MKKRFFALDMARQYRTCPPLAITEDPVHQEKWRKHLQTCPFCCDRTRNELTAWSRLLETMPRPPAEAGNRSAECDSEQRPKPGELRFLKPELAGWKHHLFFNPPLLLVLDIQNESERTLAAMTFHDTTLAAPGDLVVGPSQTTVGELIIEPWNTIILSAGNFMPVFSRLSSEIVTAVLQMARRSDSLPDGFPLPRPMMPEDPRIEFRRMEKETAAFFSRNTAETLFGLAFGPDQAAALFRETVPGVYWEYLPEALPLTLASARFPDEYYARAAQDDTEKRSWANLILIRRGRTEQFRPVQVFWEKEMLSEVLAFSGRVSALPESMKDSRFFCFLSSGAVPPIPPEYTKWDPETGYFFVTFKEKSRVTDELFMAVVGRSEE